MKHCGIPAQGDYLEFPISEKEVLDFSPSLADKLARNTSSYTVEEIAVEIAEVIEHA